MIHLQKYLIIIIFFLLSACSSVPRNTKNSCEIFKERYLWYKYSKKYLSAEREAKREELGLWKGTFDMPWDWRKNVKK